MFFHRISSNVKYPGIFTYIRGTGIYDSKFKLIITLELLDTAINFCICLSSWEQQLFANKHVYSFFFQFCSFICQVTLARKQRSDLFDLRVKLPPVTTSLTTQR